VTHWLKAEFKDDTVWAEVDAESKPVQKDGFVAIVYRPGGKAYKTRLDRLTLLDEEPLTFDPTPLPPKASTGAARGGIKSAPFSGLKGEDAVIQLWTDGACTGNPGPAGAGVLVRHKGSESEISEYLGKGTNNIAELTAILLGLQSVEIPDQPVQVITDSSYSIGLLTKGWKPKANQELVKSLKQELKRFTDVTFVKVKGHAGIDGNERADSLARSAIDNRP
jgi:ribonuclease HI